MMRTRVLLLGAAIVLGSTANAPAAATSQPFEPGVVRHLQFHVVVNDSQFGESHYAGFTDEGTRSVGTGVTDHVYSAARTVTIDVDVVGIRNDGALAVRVTRYDESTPASPSVLNAAVFGDGRVDLLQPVKGGQLPNDVVLLLRYLGRGFVPDSIGRSGGSWRQDSKSAAADVASEFTLTPSGDDLATIVKRATVTADVPAPARITETANVSYNRALSVPERIHDQLVETRHGLSLLSTLDYSLAEDSFAKAAP